jgi:hypothetical protein
MSEKEKEIRFESNPFLKDLIINRKTKQVKVSSLGKDDNVLINQTTGEVHGTHVVTYKQVDDAEFVKTFTGNIALAFDLNKAGYKTLQVVYWSVQKVIGTDVIQLNKYVYDDFNSEHDIKRFSLVVFNRGLKELETAQIIAKAKQRGFYYINPNFIFNGDRIAFTKVIERKKNDGDGHKQKDLLED